MARFEADAAGGQLAAWPARALHPTQGLAPLGAAFRAATEATVGRRWLFRHHGVEGTGGGGT